MVKTHTTDKDQKYMAVWINCYGDISAKPVTTHSLYTPWLGVEETVRKVWQKQQQRSPMK